MNSFSSFFPKNLAIIKARWPEVVKPIETAPSLPAQLVTDGPQQTLVVEGLHLSSRYDRKREAQLQAALIPSRSPSAWVYGVGLGDLPRILLERPDLCSLAVVMLNPAVVRQSLTFFDHRDWLRDTRVKLMTSGAEDEIFFPFASVPPELKLADDDAARLRDLVALELSTPFIHEKHAASQIDLAVRLQRNFGFVKEDGDVAELFGSQKYDMIYVAAAGPTLGDHYERLRTRPAGVPLIAVDATLKPLLAAGVVPDVVVTVDANPGAVLRFFEGIDPLVLTGCRLVYFPVVTDEVLRRWPGQRLVAYAAHGLYREIASSYPRTILHASGSVIHPAVDIAVKMGARQVAMVGADFSFPRGRTHVQGSAADSCLNEKKIFHWVHNGRGERVPTWPNMRGFLRDLERYIARHPEVRFLNGSADGAAIKGTSELGMVHD